MDLLRNTLQKQLETVWSLAMYHMDGITDDECLWRPSKRGPHIHRNSSANWDIDWPEHEGYDLGPPSIAWVMWHITFWWSMVIDYSFGSAELTRESIYWPGTAESSRRLIEELYDKWSTHLAACPDSMIRSHELSRWPISDRPLVDIAAWVNIELMKNVSEIGYIRFLYATRA